MKTLIEDFIKKVFLDNSLSESYAYVSESSRKELCDYQINSVFQIAKTLSKSPIEVGEKIVGDINSLEDFNDYFEFVEFVKPGFINIKVSDKLINKVLFNNMNNNYGIIKPKNELYFLDYGGPNIAKPLHIGHMRPAIIGESLKRIYNTKGYSTIGDVHLGDFGLQMGQVIYGLYKENKTIDDITIDYLNYIYPKMSKLSKEDEEVLKECQRITKELQEGNEEYTKLWKKIYEVSLEDIKRVYKFLDVDFDLWLGESDSFKTIPSLIDFLENKNVVTIDDGAKIVRVQKEDDTKDMPPLILEKSDGAHLYATTDLATIYDRVKDYNPDHILYVVDVRQSLHFEQVFRTCDISGLISHNKLEHIAFGSINGSDGKPFKTRSGETLKLDDLINLVKETFISKKEDNKNMSESDIDKIVNSIIKFADLQNNCEKNYIFDISKFSDVNGKTGPYILYSALRIKKLFNDNAITNKSITNTIYNESDRELRKSLLYFNDSITKACDDRKPHYIAEFVYDLCNKVNNFYQNNNISALTNETQKNDWLNLLQYTYEVIEKSLNMLIIEVPTKM